VVARFESTSSDAVSGANFLLLETASVQPLESLEQLALVVLGGALMTLDLWALALLVLVLLSALNLLARPCLMPLGGLLLEIRMIRTFRSATYHLTAVAKHVEAMSLLAASEVSLEPLMPSPSAPDLESTAMPLRPGLVAARAVIQTCLAYLERTLVGSLVGSLWQRRLVCFRDTGA